MQVAIYSYSGNQFERHAQSDDIDGNKVQLVLAFGSKRILATQDLFGKLKVRYPKADIVLGSTAGEVHMDTVKDNSVSVTALSFENTETFANAVSIFDFEKDSHKAGRALIKPLLDRNDLCYILLISDGEKVTGADLLRGVNELVKKSVPVSGGLAADGGKFISTLTGLNENPVSGEIIAVGFYGSKLQVSFGAQCGWESFGPVFTATESSKKILYRIDDKPALDLYREFSNQGLETHGHAYPLFLPLSIRFPGATKSIVRTLLGTSEKEKSLHFAADVPEGSTIRFMHGRYEKLIHAARLSVAESLISLAKPQFVLVVSCAARRAALKESIAEELAAVTEGFGKQIAISGFYSHGEISTTAEFMECQLHNQTISITCFREF